MSKVVLFQGDSITDSRRDRNDINHHLGTGYACMVAASLGADYPNAYKFINKGISGNRIVDLYARIKADFINLKPDIASIYIGVNDVWHEINSQNGVSAEKFEKIYTLMIDEIKEALPDIKLIIVAPFVVEGVRTCNTEEKPNRYDTFRTELAKRIEVCKRIAQKNNLPLVELQPVFDEACTKAESSYWTPDGVHPTAAGHELIKREWIKAFNNL